MKNMILIVAIAVLCGCTTSTAPRLHSESWTTNKVGDVTHEIKDTKGSAFINWGDASIIVDKFRVSNGKTHSIGVSGYESETSATNVAPVVNSAGSLIGNAAKSFLGVP